ncbi:hypothetical protein [Sorangium sp. So ce542]|uniref:hypothetical protein n=1 Tax=Sorangium sp. So ce542 TaxID=3133316 RepID=UPI003F646158
MAFTPELRAAAYRHLQAADKLCSDPGCRPDVAGYLYGIAAECAIKKMVIRLPLPTQHNKKAIEYAHFPELRTLIRDALGGRKGMPLMAFIEKDAFMNNWHVSMRYADASQIRSEWVDAWQKQAKDVVGAMDT